MLFDGGLKHSFTDAAMKRGLRGYPAINDSTAAQIITPLKSLRLYEAAGVDVRNNTAEVS